MPRRRITDEEVGLIKAMLRRKMRNRDIQFCFNRQDRSVNSGRITGIYAGDYGPEVPSAAEAALDAFLASFAPAKVGVVVDAGTAREPTLAERALARFVQRGGEWFLADGETSDQECKAEFNPRRMEPIVRAIASLANNRGGFVFVGGGTLPPSHDQGGRAKRPRRCHLAKSAHSRFSACQMLLTQCLHWKRKRGELHS